MYSRMKEWLNIREILQFKVKNYMFIKKFKSLMTGYFIDFKIDLY